MDKNSIQGLWVGVVEGQDQFVRFLFDDQYCDLPWKEEFGLEITFDEQEGVYGIHGKGVVKFERVDEYISGDIEGIGKVKLFETRPLKENVNPSLGGRYAMDNGEYIFVYFETGAEVDEWQGFYKVEKDQIVRLYAKDEHNYLSELAEHITISDEKISLEKETGEKVTGKRVPFFTQRGFKVPCPQGYTLAADLYLPHDAQPDTPITVLVHGAGPGIREDYLNFMESFIRRGLGVVIYDKRGWGESTGEQLWSEVFDLADDLNSVLDAVKAECPGRKIGIWGVSNGGWVGPYAAARDKDVSFVVVYSGSGVSPARQEQIRRMNVAGDVLGATQNQVEMIGEFWEHAFPFLATGEWTDKFRELVEAMNQDEGLQALPKDEELPDGLQPVPSIKTIEEWDEKGGNSADMIFDPVPIYNQLDAPLFCIWGEKDSMVPIQESIQALEEGLRKDLDYTYHVVPNAGHGLYIFQPFFDQLVGGEFARLGKSVRSYPPDLWDKIANWIFEKVGE